MAKVLVCWNCGDRLDDMILPISRHATCEACFEVLRCCRMCRHYSLSYRPPCDHERAEPPVVAESANFCDFFTPANRFNEQVRGRAGVARSDLDALFDGEPVPLNDTPTEVAESLLVKGSSNKNPADDAARKLKDLFDD